MKKFILILAIAVLSLGSLFAQGEKTELYVKRMLASSTITGKMEIILYTRDAITLTADSCLNFIWFNDDNDASDFTLPPAEAGMAVGFYNAKGGAVTIDPDDADNIYLDGVASGAGFEILSTGVIDDLIVLIAVDDTRWYAWTQRGTWGVP